MATPPHLLNMCLEKTTRLLGVCETVSRNKKTSSLVTTRAANICRCIRLMPGQLHCPLNALKQIACYVEGHATAQPWNKNLTFKVALA